jgi:hypothetical protein
VTSAHPVDPSADASRAARVLAWLRFLAVLALAGALHQLGLVSLVGWVPRPFPEQLVPALLVGLALVHGLLAIVPPAWRARALLAGSLVCGGIASASFTGFGVAWALAYRALLWSGARPRVTLLFPIVTVAGLLVIADAAHQPSLVMAHPWLRVVGYLFAVGWFLRALVVWQEARRGLARPSATDFLVYFLFAPFTLVPPYMLALPRLALVTDGVQRQDPAVVRAGAGWLLYGLALELALVGLGRLGLDPRELLGPALRAHDWLRAVPLLVLTYPVRAVVSACAAGALLVGLVRSFGVAMKPAFDAPLLARGVADWWRRYNLHFRELLVELLWYPVVLRHRRRPVRAAFLGCAAVFLAGSAPLHWPREWALYGTPWALPWNVIVECALMTLVVGVSLVREQRRARGPSVAPSAVRAWAERVLTWLVIGGIVFAIGYQASYRIVHEPWERAAIAVERTTTAAGAAALLPRVAWHVTARPREPARQLALARLLALTGDVDGACAAVARARAFADRSTVADVYARARLEAGLIVACPRSPPPRAR